MPGVTQLRILHLSTEAVVRVRKLLLDALAGRTSPVTVCLAVGSSIVAILS